MDCDSTNAFTSVLRFFIHMEFEKGRKALKFLQTLWQNSVV